MSAYRYARLGDSEAQSAEDDAAELGEKGYAASAKSWLDAKKAIGAFVLLGIVLLLVGLVASPPSNAVSNSAQRVEVVSHVSLDREAPAAAANASLPRSVLENLALTESQCDGYFPLHREEAAFVGGWTRAHGGVSMSDVEYLSDKLNARVLIKDGRMYLRYYRGGWKYRAFGALQSLYQAVSFAPEAMPDVELTMQVNDQAVTEKAIFGLARRTDEPAWLLADFAFSAWPETGIGSYANYHRDVEQVAELLWQDKEPKLFWRGAPMNDWRQQLIWISDSQYWGDCQAIDWEHRDEQPIVSMLDHARYQFLAATEGTDSYSGRLKYLLNSRSVVISHPLRWQQPWHRALDGRDGSPTQNIVFTEGPGFEGLESIVERLLADPAQARLIANNAYETFHKRYLSPAAVACWWRTVLKEYSRCMAFDPQLDSTAKDIESVFLAQSLDFRKRRRRSSVAAS